jgi:hypothetical protein
LVPFAVLAALALGGMAAYQEGQRRLDVWLRQKLAGELARENLRADIGKMTLDPLRGLVARDCRLYGGKDQKLLLATFDRLRVEADLSRLLHRQQFINSVTLTDAALALPLDPENPQTQWLTLTGLNASILASGDRFEVRQARALLEGVPVTVEGTLLKPSKMQRSRSRPKDEKREALDLLRERRHWLDELRGQLRQLKWETNGRPPQLDLRLTADLDRPAELRLWGRLHGQNFRYRDYVIRDLEVAGEWSRGEATIREARLRDTVGTLTGSARMEPGRPRPEYFFTFQSTANLPALIGAIREVPALKEFVLYEPDSLSTSGEASWRPASADGSSPAALQMMGRLTSGRFATRGAVFESVDAAFFLKDGDINLRNVRLAHASGTLNGQAMRQSGQWRYQVQMRMNPKALQPFTTTAAQHRLFDRLDFQDQSSMELEARGSGPQESLQSWEHEATVDARQFRYQGEVIRRLQANLGRREGTTLATAVRLVRPEGELTAARLTIAEAAQTLLIDDLRSTVFPAPVVRQTSPHIFHFVDAYQFSQPPTIRMAGRVGLKNVELNDFTLDVVASGDVQATLPDRTVLPLISPRGQITSKGRLLSLDLTGQVQQGASWRGTTLDETVAARFLGAFPLIFKKEPRSESWQFFLTGPARVRQVVGSSILPVEVAKATVDFRHRRAETQGASVQVEADGRVLAPAQFQQLTLRDPAMAQFQGVFDAEKRSPENVRTRWSLNLEAPGTIDWKFSDKSLPLQEVKVEAEFQRGRLEFQRTSASLLGGSVTGTGEVNTLAATQDFVATVQAENVGFGALAKIYAPGTLTAGQLSGGFRLTGNGRPDANDSLNLQGSGQAVVREGDIFAMPLLGPLSPLLSSMLPGTKSGYSQARDARASFALSDGLLTTRDFEALTMAFVIKGGGEINLESKRVDLQARINTRGPTGMLLYPVSRLLEFEAQGTINDPAWTPGVLNLPGKLLPLPGVRRR